MTDYVAIANQYIDDVLSGEIIACEFVKLACKRQRKDLALQNFKYTFSEKHANRVCKFIELLPHTKGRWARERRLIELEPWQIFILTTVFGWIDSQGLRRFKTVYTEIPRKNGKSAISSGVGLYMLAADNEAGAEVYSAATTREQAAIVWKTAKLMADKSPGLQSRFGVETSTNTIFVDHNDSVFKPLSRDQGGNHDGYSVSCGIIDELHAHKTRDIFDVIETGTGSRDQPLIWSITTAGTNRAGICYEQRAYTIKLLNKVVNDNEYFGIIFTIDDKDDWTNPKIWIKANPNWGVSVSPEDIQRKARKAIQTPSAQNNFKTKHLNVWCNANTAWMNMQDWDACERDINLETYRECKAWLGVDLASKIDIACIGIIIETPNGYVAFVFSFLNEQAVEDDKNSQYSGWVNSGHIIQTEGNVTDFEAVEDKIKWLCGLLDVQDICFDPWQSQRTMQNLMAEALPVVEYGQTVKNMSEPMKTLEALVRKGELIHDGNPCLAWMMSNVVCHTDAKENIYPRKEFPQNKIDGPVSLITALGRALAVEGDGPSIYETRGVLAW